MVTLSEALADRLSETPGMSNQKDVLTLIASAPPLSQLTEIQTEPKKNTVKFNEFVEKIEVELDEEEEVAGGTTTI